MPAYPRHLATFDYIGAYAYFLTFCTFERNPLFLTPDSIAIVHEQILRVCAAHGFQIDAYCYMPDHVHMVITAIASDSDLKHSSRARNRLPVSISRKQRNRGFGGDTATNAY